MEVHKTGTRKILEDDNKIRENFPLQHHKENEEMFMLGMYRALDGNNKDRFKYMQKKGNRMGNLNKSRWISTKGSMEILKLSNSPNNKITSIFHDTQRERM